MKKGIFCILLFVCVSTMALPWDPHGVHTTISSRNSKNNKTIYQKTISLFHWLNALNNNKDL